VSQPVRHPDQSAEQHGNAHDVAAGYRRYQVQEILPGLPGRFGDLDAGGGHWACRQIERDLRDDAQQRLVSLALQLRAAQAAVPPELSELGADLERITAGLTDALEELRKYARGIHPAILTEHGLGSALKALARRCPIPLDLDITHTA
jgi:Histidine kinase